MNRRHLLHKGGSCLALSLSGRAFAVSVPHRVMTHIERVDASLEGRAVDRPPYTIYQNVERSTSTPDREARAELHFHESFNTDIVKVMNPYPYPASTSRNWFDLKALDSPYPDQLKTVKMIRSGLKGKAYFVDTICSPFTTAWSLFCKNGSSERELLAANSDANLVREFREFQNSKKEVWSSAVDAITESTIQHIHKLKEIGAAGVFVNVVNMSALFGTAEEYREFSKPYDERVFQELSDMKLTILHPVGLDRAFLDHVGVYKAPILHYSTVRTGIPISEVRKQFSGTIMGGVDELSYDSLSAGKIRKQWTSAREQAGPRFIAAPGGAVPAQSTGRQIGHLQDSLDAW